MECKEGDGAVGREMECGEEGDGGAWGERWWSVEMKVMEECGEEGDGED